MIWIVGKCEAFLWDIQILLILGHVPGDWEGIFGVLAIWAAKLTLTSF